MSTFRQMARLQRGLVTDQVGMPGALLEADDVVPLERGEGFRTRGGKQVLTAATASGLAAAPASSTAITGMFAWSLLGTQGGGRAYSSYPFDALVEYETDFGATHGWMVLAYDGSAAALPSQAANHAGAALAFDGRTNQFVSMNGAGVVYGEELWVPAHSSWGGISMRHAGVAPVTAFPYSTGTVTGTTGSTVLTGSGTSWQPYWHEGGYIYVNDADMYERAYRIVRVLSATQLEVDRPLQGPVNAASYRMSVNAAWTCKPGTFGATDWGYSITSFSTVNAIGACEHQGRVIVWDTVDADNLSYPDRLRWSYPINETDGHWGGAENFHPNAFADAAPGSGRGFDPLTGRRTGVVWCTSFQGALYVFKHDELHVLRGQLISDGSDEGASIELVARLEGVVNGYAKPVPTDEGIYFVTSQGLMLVNGGGVVNVSRASLARQAFIDVFGDDATVPVLLSVLRDRIVLQPGRAQYPIADVGTTYVTTLVLDRRWKVWTTQTTLGTTNVIEATYGQQLSVGQWVDGATSAYIVLWQGDNTFSGVVTEKGRAPLMKLTTHPVSVSDRGAVNGRLRGAQVKAKVLDTDATNPTLGVTVLLGEQGRSSAVEAAIAATRAVPEQTVTEKWHRIPVRSGTPMVDQVRLRMVQAGGSADVRVTEVGVEHVAVRRFR